MTDDQGRVLGFTDVESPEEAAVVREIVDRLLAGESLHAVTDDLNQRQVPPPGAAWTFAKKERAKGNEAGARWGRTSVKKLATRRANVAERVHHKGQRDESVHQAAWPAIVDRDKHDRVVALLTDPSRTTERPGSRQHVLTWGVGQCGVCGEHLRVATRGNAVHGKKESLYCCAGKGCTGRDQQRVDDLVRQVVIARMTRPDALDWLSGDDAKATEARDKIAALKARLELAADQFADGAITVDQLTRITAKLRPQIEEAEADRLRSTVRFDPATVQAIAGDATGQVWDGMSASQRRALLLALGVTVKLMPVTRRGPGFDPQSVAIAWAR